MRRHEIFFACLYHDDKINDSRTVKITKTNHHSVLRANLAGLPRWITPQVQKQCNSINRKNRRRKIIARNSVHKGINKFKNAVVKERLSHTFGAANSPVPESNSRRRCGSSRISYASRAARKMRSDSRRPSSDLRKPLSANGHQATKANENESEQDSEFKYHALQKRVLFIALWSRKKSSLVANLGGAASLCFGRPW